MSMQLLIDRSIISSLSSTTLSLLRNPKSYRGARETGFLTRTLFVDLSSLLFISHFFMLDILFHLTSKKVTAL